MQCPKARILNGKPNGKMSIWNGSAVKKVTEKVTENVTEKERELLGLLLEDPGYTMLQLAEKMKISRKTVAARLKSLKEKGIIERVGSDRKGYWKILH